MHGSDELNVLPASQQAGEVIVLEGDLRLPQADGVRRRLLDAMRPGQTTWADLSAVTDVDLAGLQLICSAHRGYRKHEAVFQVRGMPDWMRETAASAGFEAHHSLCPNRGKGITCLWLA